MGVPSALASPPPGASGPGSRARLHYSSAVSPTPVCPQTWFCLSGRSLGNCFYRERECDGPGENYSSEWPKGPARKGVEALRALRVKKSTIRISAKKSPSFGTTVTSLRTGKLPHK